ncbi:uncharacterized protein LOC111664920 [Seriola lalandi dorsalis]|uniref:uncharacterized protein LOC111664920 n=1 Tax=Seriola lalandi dorsalis TaxID=1841481 RepID=UPI000C6F8B5A|nr:uncharacterized protein LOC111664920 [Seriola lalandi dorsalis]
MNKQRKMMMLCLLLAAFCSPVFSGEWKATVVKDLKALVTSCIVIPCSFTHPKENLPSSRLRGIWQRSNDKQAFVYNEDKTRILENFRVTHTCPSHVPTLTWSRSTPEKIVESHRQLHPGHWETQSILAFIPEEKDDHSEITCTAVFNGQKTSSATMKLYIKRTENYNHIIIPTVVGISIAVVFGLFCIFIVKKYKNRIAELQNQEGTMLNRLSRLSRRNRV